MSEAESLWVSRANRKAQTGHSALSSSGNSVPQTGQALLPCDVTTVSSKPIGFYSILRSIAYRKIAWCRWIAVFVCWAKVGKAKLIASRRAITERIFIFPPGVQIDCRLAAPKIVEAPPRVA